MIWAYQIFLVTQWDGSNGSFYFNANVFKILWNIKRAVELKRADLVKTNRIKLKSIMIEVEVVNNETFSRFPFATNSSFTTTSWKPTCKMKNSILITSTGLLRRHKMWKTFHQSSLFSLRPEVQGWKRWQSGYFDRPMPASDEKWKVFLNEDPRILVAGSHLAGDWGDGV